MGASSSVLLNQFADDKQEEVKKRFMELTGSGKSEEEACAMVLEEFQTNLPQPPQDKINDTESELPGSSVEILMTCDTGKVNKSKLTLIKKKARRSNPPINLDSTPESNLGGSEADKNIIQKGAPGGEFTHPTVLLVTSTVASLSSEANNSSGSHIETSRELSALSNPIEPQVLNSIVTTLPSSASPLSKEDLMCKHAEMQFLLRSPLTSDSEIDTASIAAAQGLAFIENLTHYSESMGENRGMLLRWVLPFDSTTSIADQSNVQAAGSYIGSGTGSAVSEEQQRRFSAVIDEAAKASLLEGAMTLRKLVRVKLSDEADLKQALVSVADTNAFLSALRARAHHDKITPFELLQTL